MLQDLNKVVTAGVGPIIVISACGLLCSTFYNRITNVIVGLRAIQRERRAEEAYLLRETDPRARARRHPRRPTASFTASASSAASCFASCPPSSRWCSARCSSG